MTIETQQTISVWGTATFGESTPTELGILASAEIVELLDALGAGHPADIEEEAADVAIFLMRLASVSGFNLLSAVNRKMAINRRRRWVKQEDGTWLKVKEAAI